MYDELMKSIIPTEFLLDLSLICDALPELQAFLEHQARNTDLYHAHQQHKDSYVLVSTELISLVYTTLHNIHIFDALQ
jgi:hypothetical protein